MERLLDVSLTIETMGLYIFSKRNQLFLLPVELLAVGRFAPVLGNIQEKVML